MLDDLSVRTFKSLDEVGRVEALGNRRTYSTKSSLENEPMVAVDLPSPERRDGNEPAHYVAMSRARSVLSLIYRAEPSHSSCGPSTEGAPS